LPAQRQRECRTDAILLVTAELPDVLLPPSEVTIMPRIRICAIAGLGVIALTQSFSLAQPLFRTIGEPGETYTFVVSADGRVVAGQSRGGVLRWTIETGAVLLGRPPAPYNGDPIVSAISRDGTMIVRYALDFSQKIFPSGAFIWTQATGITYLGPPGGADGSQARGISDDGSRIVGD